MAIALVGDPPDLGKVILSSFCVAKEIAARQARMFFCKGKETYAPFVYPPNAVPEYDNLFGDWNLAVYPLFYSMNQIHVTNWELCFRLLNMTGSMEYNDEDIGDIGTQSPHPRPLVLHYTAVLQRWETDIGTKAKNIFTEFELYLDSIFDVVLETGTPIYRARENTTINNDTYDYCTPEESANTLWKFDGLLSPGIPDTMQPDHVTQNGSAKAFKMNPRHVLFLVLRVSSWFAPHSLLVQEPSWCTVPIAYGMIVLRLMWKMGKIKSIPFSSETSMEDGDDGSKDSIAAPIPVDFK